MIDWNQINILDLFFSLLITTAFAAILTVGYHDELDNRLPTVESLENTINDWIENTDWADKEDNSQAQRDHLSTFENSCTELGEIFSNANTRAGNQLSGEFEAWVSNFKGHNGQAKELVIQGQNHNKASNPELQMELLFWALPTWRWKVGGAVRTLCRTVSHGGTIPL